MSVEAGERPERIFCAMCSDLLGLVENPDLLSCGGGFSRSVGE
jgi:hypothetical protein